MSKTNKMGDIGETRVIYEATKRGFGVLVPFGHDNKYDLVIDRNDTLERVQVKTTTSDGVVIKVPGRSVSNIIKGKQIRTRYTSKTIDWMVIYDLHTDKCFYLPSSFLGTEGKDYIYLRYTAKKNGPSINWASDYTEWC